MCYFVDIVFVKLVKNDAFALDHETFLTIKKQLWVLCQCFSCINSALKLMSVLMWAGVRFEGFCFSLKTLVTVRMKKTSILLPCWWFSQLTKLKWFCTKTGCYTKYMLLMLLYFDSWLSFKTQISSFNMFWNDGNYLYHIWYGTSYNSSISDGTQQATS